MALPPTDPVAAIHPAPVRYWPPNAIGPRTALVRLVTPARVGRAGPGAFEPIGGGGLRTGLMALREGEPWIRLQGGFAPRTAQRVSSPGFLAWLSGEDVGGLGPVLDDLLRGTPLVAATGRTEGPGYHQRRAERGNRETAPKAVRVVHDTSGDARDALRRFLAEEVALVGEAVMVRSRALAVPRRRKAGLQVGLEPFPLSIAGSPLHLGTDPMPVGVDRVAAACRKYRRDTGLAPVVARDVEALATVLSRSGRPALAEADDLHHLAHALGPFVADQFERILDRARRADAQGTEPICPTLASLDDRLGRLRCQAMIGGIAAAEIPVALGLVDEAAEEFDRRGARFSYDGDPVRAVRDHLRSDLVPARAIVPAGDAAAFALLSP